MSKKRSTFCTIAQWLEKEDNTLYEAIQAICAMRFLKPSGGSGLTFIYPEEEKYRDKIVQSQFGDSTEQLEGEKMVRSLILYHFFPNAAAFAQHKGDIANALGNKVKLVKTSGNSVELDGGATLAPDKDFTARSDRSDMAVWRISKGTMPSGSEKAVVAKKGKPVKGGARVALTNRPDFARAVENNFRGFIEKKCSGVSSKGDPYAEALMSLFMWLKNTPEHMPILRALLACTGTNWRIAFYNVFQPDKGSNYLLDSGLFEQWQNETNGHCFVDNPAQRLVAFASNLNSSTDKDLMASEEGRAKYRAAVGTVRHGLLQSINQATLGSEMVSQYQQLSRTNHIAGLDEPVFPEVLAAYYAANPDIKCLQEELRFVGGQAFEDIEDDSHKASEYKNAHAELCQILKTALNLNGGLSSCSLFNNELQKSSVVWYSRPFALLRSTHFMSCGGATSGELLGEIPEPDDAEVVDTVGHEFAKWKSMAPSCDGALRFQAAATAVELARKEMK